MLFEDVVCATYTQPTQSVPKKTKEHYYRALWGVVPLSE